MAIIEKLRKEYGNMSAVEQRITDVIMEDPVQVSNMTIAHFAAKAYVSEGSIINFANRHGLRGFSALKIELARETDTTAGFSFGSVTERDTPWSALRKVTGNAVDAFQKTCQLIQEEDLKEAAESLMSARRIDIYGVSDSGLLAQDFYLHLLRIGLPVCVVTDYMSFDLAASQLNADCVAVAISHFGQTIEVVDAMAIAKRQGAKTICITSSVNSLLQQLCDISLVVSSEESKQHQEAAVSRLAHMLVMDSLCAYISAQQGAEVVERMDEVSRHLARYRYQRREEV